MPSFKDRILALLSHVVTFGPDNSNYLPLEALGLEPLLFSNEHCLSALWLHKGFSRIAYTIQESGSGA